MTRLEKIKKYGLEIVEYDEKIWLERGYTINYSTGLLEPLTNKYMNISTSALAYQIRSLVDDGALALDDKRDCLDLAWQFANAIQKENPTAQFSINDFLQDCGVHSRNTCEETPDTCELCQSFEL